MTKTNVDKLIEVQARIAKKRAELKKLQDTERNLKLIIENEALRAQVEVAKQVAREAQTSQQQVQPKPAQVPTQQAGEVRRAAHEPIR